MGSSKKQIIIIAGEASGDTHAAHLVMAVKHLNPTLQFSGLGGPKMAEAGVTIYHDLTKIAVVGFWEVLKHYAHFKKIFQSILVKIDALQPATVILVDYPGFNLRLAKELKQRNIKVIYYISPQVWAWKKKRVYFIKQYVDKMLVLFQFEKDFYAHYGMDVDFVGHPLIDEVKTESDRSQYLQSIGLYDYNITIGLLPGSREKEIERHLPVMLDAAGILHKKHPMLQFIMVKAPSIDQTRIDTFLKHTQTPIKVVEQKQFEAVDACDLCMVSSGTATLETAILKKPMVVIYKTSFPTWLLAKLFVKIPDIALVNIVARKRIVPELVQFQATPHNIAKKMTNLFSNENLTNEIKENLRAVKESLGHDGASKRAAKVTLDFIK